MRLRIGGYWYNFPPDSYGAFCSLQQTCAVTILDRPEPDRSREPRRWTVQPAPTRTSVPFEGAVLLDEVQPAALASLLWHCLRAVQLWADTGITQRRDLFSGLPSRAREIAAEYAPSELSSALDRIFGMMEHPDTSEHRPVAAACQEISTWAAQSGFPGTESEFAEAGAYVLPKDADAALFAGRGARRAGALDRAQRWLLAAGEFCTDLADENGTLRPVKRIG